MQLHGMSHAKRTELKETEGGLLLTQINLF